MVCSEDGRSRSSFSQGFLYTKLISSWLNLDPGMESKTPNGRGRHLGGRKITQLLSPLLTHFFMCLDQETKQSN